jgi:DNA polymerase III alpha subunit
MRVRTGYSFHHAAGHLPQVLARLQEMDWGCAPISDRLSAFAFAPWTLLCKEANIRPVYGIELPVTAGRNDYDHWTFYAIDDITYIYRLIAQATAKPNAAALTYAEAIAADGVIKMAGERCQKEGINKKVFMPLSPSLPLGQYNAMKKAGCKFMATSDNVYTTEDDKEFYRVALGRRAGVQTYAQHLLTDEAWRKAVTYADRATITAALQARERALAMCRATLPRASLLKPKRPKSLRAMCEAGAKAKNVSLADPTYRSRLDHELQLIAEKKFEDYFYIVAELVQWAKARMIVGPARGSSCGSLVCYLLNITAVDPIPFGLLFERFIDVTRSDLPDIDIDFEDEKRNLVFQHAAELYGAERIARLGNVMHFKARSALKAAATALRIPDFMINKVMDVMIERTSGDARANEALADTFKATDVGRSLRAEYPSLAIAERMEGHPSNAGQHAAGIVLTNEKVADYVAIDRRNGVAMCDKRDVETFGLLKIDALGLTQLGVFGRTMELLGRQPHSGWLESLPLDDQAAFDVLNRGHYAGIFQFNGIAVQSMAKAVHITSINDIIAMTALGRPGPMGSGGAQRWSLRRRGAEAVTYEHPLVQPYLEETLGVITYQEQVMQLGRHIGDLSWKDVTALRKAMSKSMGQDYFDTFGNKWKASAVNKGMPQEIADKFWMDLCTFGNWGFNKSHAVAYGLVSYWCCYLKAHHPLEFAAATLDNEDDPVRQIALLRELKDEGIEYVPVDPARSTDRWQPYDGNKLLGPLTAIKGIGPAAVKAVMEARASNKPLKPAMLAKLQTAQTSIGSLYPIADRIAELDLPAMNILSQHTPVKEVQTNGGDYTVLIIGVLKKLAPKDLNEQVNVARRISNGWRGKYPDEEPHLACNLFITDDTDQIFCQIGRYQYEQLALPMLETGGVGKAIYAIKGICPADFRMVKVQRVKLLGSMDGTDLTFKPEGGGTSKPTTDGTGIAA